MLPTDGMVIAGDRVLDVTEQSVVPIELRVRHAGTPSAGDVMLMNVGGRIEGSETPEPSLMIWLPRTRAREGRDLIRYPYFIRQCVSIHAPARGATAQS